MARILEKLKRILNSLKKSPTFFGAILYGWLCLLGMLHAHSFYGTFDIDIFRFAEPLDFLLVAFSKASMVLGILWGIFLALVISVIVLFLLSLIGYFFFIRKSIESYIVWIYEWVKRCILLADQTFIDSFRAAWITFRRELRVARESLTNSLNKFKDSRDEAWEKCASFFWHWLFVSVTAMFIFASVCVPRYQGEQDSNVLVDNWKNKKSARTSPVLQIDSALSFIYSEWINKPLTVWLFGKPDDQQPVRITLRQDAPQSKTRLPVPELTLFLGTTSSFHFFYEIFYEECEHSQDVDGDGSNDEISPPTENGLGAQTAQTQEDTALADIMVCGRRCENGRPFVIPTANIASLEFNPKPPEPKKEQVGLPDILAAISQLNKTISTLKFDATINMQSGEVIFDTKAVADAIAKVDSTVAAINEGNETNTEEITNAIESLKLTIVSNPNSDGLVKAINALSLSVQNLHFPGVQNHCASGWRKVATIGPFPIGDHDQLEETVRECQNQLIPPDQFVNEINGHFTNQQPLLIGRVDITQLSEQARKDYGSDSGLAQARAKWVRDELVEKSQNTEQKEALRQAILLSAGPLHVGENVSNDDRAKDRSVEVWACWTPKDPE